MAPACLANVVMIVVMLTLPFWHIEITWLKVMGIYFGGALMLSLLPMWIITFANGCICLAWWFRIGHLTTWKGIEKRIENRADLYEVHVKRIYTGMASFGAYTTYGGGPSFLLRNRATGALWAIVGKALDQHKAYGIVFYED